MSANIKVVMLASNRPHSSAALLPQPVNKLVEFENYLTGVTDGTYRSERTQKETADRDRRPALQRAGRLLRHPDRSRGQHHGPHSIDEPVERLGPGKERQ